MFLKLTLLQEEACSHAFFGSMPSNTIVGKVWVNKALGRSDLINPEPVKRRERLLSTCVLEGAQREVGRKRGAR